MKKTILILALAGGALSGCVHLPIPASTQVALTPSESVTLGDTYLAKGDKNLAIQQYESALLVDKKYVPALMALGNLAFQDKEFEKARSYFKRAHDADPKDAAVVNNLAMVYLAEGKDLKGIDILVEEALEGAGPATPYLWDTLGNIAIRQGRYADAENALKRAAQTAPPQDPEFQKHLQESRAKLAYASSSSH